MQLARIFMVPGRRRDHCFVGMVEKSAVDEAFLECQVYVQFAHECGQHESDAGAALHESFVIQERRQFDDDLEQFAMLLAQTR